MTAAGEGGLRTAAFSRGSSPSWKTGSCAACTVLEKDEETALKMPIGAFLKNGQMSSISRELNCMISLRSGPLSLERMPRSSKTLPAAWCTL